MTSLSQPPVKRSVTIAGHPTSIRLEPLFWAALDSAARQRSLPLNALVARIDAERLTAGGDAPLNLASAIRVWLLENGPFPTKIGAPPP